MTGQRERHALFSGFKNILRERKITYGELARRTGFAESTIKRLFAIEECSLSKLMQLLSATGLQLSDLTKYIEEREVNSSYFSMESEEFLAKNLDFFIFYRRLFYFKTVERLQESDKMSPTKLKKYLKKLDDLDILKWLPEDEIQFLQKGFLKFRKNGPLKDAVYKWWIPIFTEKVLHTNIDEQSNSIRLFSTRATQESIEKFHNQYNELTQQFLKTASLDIKLSPSEVHPIGVCQLSGPYRVGIDLTL